ncbi:hypothetical protein JCM3770_006564 [Rhodotorula araucariae]
MSALWVCGSNSHGQLACSHSDDCARWTRVALAGHLRPVAVACGANHSLLLAADARTGERLVLGAGSNARGQLSPPAAPALRLEFTPLPLALPPPLSLADYSCVRIAACCDTSLVVLRPADTTRSDILVSLGANDWGERASPVASLAAASLVDLAALVDQHARDHTTLRIVDLEAGPRHALALVELSSSSSSSSSPAPRRILASWGASRHGQLGHAPSSPSSSSPQPPRVTYTPREVVLPPGYTGADVASFAAGRDHTAVLLRRVDEADQRVLLVGSNRHRQLGPPGDEDPAARRNVLDLAQQQQRVTAVHCTWSSTLLALSPNPDPNPKPNPSLSPDPPAPPRPPAAALPPPGRERPRPSLVAFGLDSHGQLGIPPSAPAPASVPAPAPAPARGGVAYPRLSAQHRLGALAAGSEHVLALLVADGNGDGDGDGARGPSEVWGWGWNEHGNLPSPVPVPLSPAERESGDVWSPRRIWTSDERRARAVRVWAGMASSWVLVEHDDAPDREGVCAP